MSSVAKSELLKHWTPAAGAAHAGAEICEYGVLAAESTGGCLPHGSLYLTGGQALSHLRSTGRVKLMEPSSRYGTDVAPESPKQRVLIVDNDPTSRDDSAAALRSVGLEVSEARDAEEGYAKAHLEHPHLIVCNLSPLTTCPENVHQHDRPAIMFPYSYSAST